jgi:AbiJ N-terminal domain 4
MLFSDRIGITSNKKQIQIETIDQDLKNGIWNIIKLEILDKLATWTTNTSFFNSPYATFLKHTWNNYYKTPIDELKYMQSQDMKSNEKFIKDKFFNGSWYEPYNFAQFCTDYKTGSSKDIFSDRMNLLFEREFSGYRFINNILAPISNQHEIEEINTTLDSTNQFTSLQGVNTHLNTALIKISDKQNPDYRNSIKESISAVETCARVLTGENTLGAALNNLSKKGIDIDPLIKLSFEKLYAFTNNKDSGIRHAIVEDHKNPDFADAKYMLVASSSIINYLIMKAEGAGINFM